MTTTNLSLTAADAYKASLKAVADVCPEVAQSILAELHSQRSHLKLIASENYSSPAVQLAMGNWMTDKYAEGVPGRRFYAGCENVDAIERLAAKLACQLFGADHAYVQPHSGADANLVAFLAILFKRVEIPVLEGLGVVSETGAVDAGKLQQLSRADWQTLRARFGEQRMLALDFRAGGHLTHGYRLNVSSRLFDVYSYSVDPGTGLIDYAAIRKQALEVRPLILLAGYSAYTRKLNFATLRAIADECGATLMVDMAHFAGLVAGKVFTGEFDPVPYADVVTSTTHKTLRGPRGGLILCKTPYAEAIDRGCPLILGGPLPHVMAAKAVCFAEALRPAFVEYAHRIVANSNALGEGLKEAGFTLVSNGTENHIVLLDLSAETLTGRQGEDALRSCGITVNRNAIPGDRRSPLVTSGLRLGTAALTTLGMGTEEMKEVARLIALVLKKARPALIASGPRQGTPSQTNFELDEAVRTEAVARVGALLGRFPLYPFLDTAVDSLAR